MAIMFLGMGLVLIPSLAEERGMFSGTVVDSSGGSLTDASVTAVNYDTGIRRSSHSDASGDYAIGSLPAGNYKITVRKPGFQTVARLDVILSSGQNVSVDFSMQVGSTREVITIHSAPPEMNTEDAAAGMRISGESSRSFPATGRGVLQTAQLAPGIIQTAATQVEAGQFSVNGQRPNANYFSVDGVSANTGVSGSSTPAQFSGGTLPAMTAFGSTATLSVEAGIDEVRIQTSGFAPEFGHTPGAQVEITTRSGTNELHGAVSAVTRSQTFDANSWFNTRSGMGRAPAAFFDGTAAVGRPLRRDRTFLFGLFEGQRMGSPQTWDSAVPSLQSRNVSPARVRPVLNAFPVANGPSLPDGTAVFTANVSRAARFAAATLRVDHALTTRISLFGRYQSTPSNADSGLAQIDHSKFTNQSFTFGSSALVSPNVTNDIRFNFTRTSVTSSWYAASLNGSVPVDLTSIFPVPVPTGTMLYGFAIGGIGQILSGEPGRSRQTQWQVTDALAWTHQAHALRFGVDSISLLPVRDRLAASVAGSYSSLPELLANAPMVVSESQATAASSRIETLSLFAQDTWRLGAKVVLNYGLRWELTPAPVYRMLQPLSTPPPQTAPVTWATRYTQWAPRVGLAYQVTSATVLRAGWGVFYDTEFAAATDPINALPYNHWQFGTQSGSLPFAPITSTITGAGFGPNLHMPYANEWNVAVDHEFAGKNVISTSYLGSRGQRLLRREAAPGPPNLIAVSPLATNNGHSRFEALELQYRRTLAAGWQGFASYTWSHTMDNGSLDSGIYLAGSETLDRGPADFDVRHNLSAGLSWHHGHWLASTLITARTGFPIDVLASENLLGLEFDDALRPNRDSTVPIWLVDPSSPGGRRLNPAAFAPGAAGQQGNLGRNAIRGFGMAQLDAAIEREFALKESVLSLRLEAFNLTNHAQFADPIRYLNSPLFGRSISTLNSMLGGGTPHSGIAPALQSGGARVLQAIIRFQF